MCRKVGDRIHEPVGIPAESDKIRCLIITRRKVLAKPPGIPNLDRCRLFIEREKYFNILLDPAVRQLNITETFKFLPEVCHILFCLEQSIIGLVHLRIHIARMDHGPAAARRVKREVQSILTNDTDRREADLNRT